MMPNWLRNHAFIGLSLAVNLLLFLSIPLLSQLSGDIRPEDFSDTISFRKMTRVRPRELPPAQPSKPPEPRKMPRVPRSAGLASAPQSAAAPRPRATLSAPSFEMAPSKMATGIAAFAPLAPPRSEFDLSQVDTQPQLVGRVHPTYPYEARQKNLQGVVIVRFLVDAEGRVTRASVVEARPAQVFEQAALDAVRKWRFQPARIDSERVATWMSVPIRFKMDK
jgi:protein TonB